MRYVEHSELTETSEVVETGHVMMFLSNDFVITVRHGAPTELGSLRADLEAKPELLAQGPWAVAHAIYDRVVDSYLEMRRARSSTTSTRSRTWSSPATGRARSSASTSSSANWSSSSGRCCRCSGR